ncbi:MULTISPECIES: alkene reductase [unclassified Curtobacterium]|uniref:alkene reductase n=1 Tax=unclassified Curtobacterium TaxID=257496 RepID=UPI000DA80702|nr:MULTISPECIES: alkene reductase [unclassified Curtobacterium]PZE27331.1 alkene reductase [Curtobacterium sp. MCBD17_028]PZE76213.1 alkene reductase [Curtobacterium sp. MCBD17_019]WIB63429.1 alkene reductase [Curtobacterium sp. MCBD17_040]WIB67258.1 alkene reductase [Curtobacterium sp. MCBD17_035]WIE54449.1 alkene reductase [Curtobacterium sp. MCBD17_003]
MEQPGSRFGPRVNLFDPAQFGDLQLRNRIVMAPLTRTRAGVDGVPNDLLVEHYAQRAGLGMIVTEGTWPVQESRSYPGQPGIETDEQVAGWARVADAVHAAGGTIVMQLMHGGRVSHTDISLTPRIVGPSALAAPGEAHTPLGKAEYPVPHALTTDEVHEVVEQFVAAARNAIRAGFDGVEVHGANGYLVHQFLSPASNERTDEYGGTPENRARLAVEVTAAVAAAVGAGRTGIRLSPEHNIQGALETDRDDLVATYTAVAEGLAPLGLAFVDVLHAEPAGDFVQGIRRTIGAPFIANSGFSAPTTRTEAIGLVEAGLADAVGVGRAAIANPDLATRWERDAEENTPNPATFYGTTAEGYTDYPALSA